MKMQAESTPRYFYIELNFVVVVTCNWMLFNLSIKIIMEIKIDCQSHIHLLEKSIPATSVIRELNHIY